MHYLHIYFLPGTNAACSLFEDLQRRYYGLMCLTFRWWTKCQCCISNSRYISASRSLLVMSLLHGYFGIYMFHAVSQYIFLLRTTSACSLFEEDLLQIQYYGLMCVTFPWRTKCQCCISNSQCIFASPSLLMMFLFHALSRYFLLPSLLMMLLFHAWSWYIFFHRCWWC